MALEWTRPIKNAAASAFGSRLFVVKQPARSIGRRSAVTLPRCCVVERYQNEGVFASESLSRIEFIKPLLPPVLELWNVREPPPALVWSFQPGCGGLGGDGFGPPFPTSRAGEQSLALYNLQCNGPRAQPGHWVCIHLECV